jgi:hypothetical protein
MIAGPVNNNTGFSSAECPSTLGALYFCKIEFCKKFNKTLQRLTCKAFGGLFNNAYIKGLS